MISIILSSSTSNNLIEIDNVLKSIRIKEKLLSAINMFLIFKVFAHVNNYSSISYESSKSRTRFGDDEKPPERHFRGGGGGGCQGRTQSRPRGHDPLVSSSLIQRMTNNNDQKKPALLFQRSQCVNGPRCVARLAPLERIRLPKPPSASEAQERRLLLLLPLQSSTYGESRHCRAPTPDIPVTERLRCWLILWCQLLTQILVLLRRETGGPRNAGPISAVLLSPKFPPPVSRWEVMKSKKEEEEEEEGARQDYEIRATGYREAGEAEMEELDISD